MKRAGLVWRTIRHLTARQLAYQVLSRLRGRGRLRLPEAIPEGYSLTVMQADKPVSWESDTFMFLNQSVHMPVIDWNYTAHGKLWTYNLNYFDFLNQSCVDRSAGMPVETGLMLIRSFMAQTNTLNDGLEPYPTSLRIINWIQFLSRNQIQNDRITQHLYAQACMLRQRIEYHIAGNHLLENGFALLTVALYVRQDAWFRQAAKLVRAELSMQLLADGCHDERSPMYHQILLDRLLDVLLALRHDTWHNDPTLIGFLEEKAARMLGWLNAITFRNGNVPMLNDAAPAIAPPTAQLQAKAVCIGLEPYATGSGASDLAASGYRKFTSPRYELVADVGAIGPTNQPGHAHADTFSFVLHVDNQPLIVDSGTSTYETGARRALERSTAAHNTVDVMHIDSSEVWAGFRVGRRARPTVLTDKPTMLTACHDGFRHMGITHERTWLVGPMHVHITDRLLAKGTCHLSGIARLHFHPDVVVSLGQRGVECAAMRITFASMSAPELRLTTYEMADGFNRLRRASCVEITFKNYLETVLIPIP